LRFTINEQGEAADIEASTGSKLLQDAAVENVHNWKFRPARCACRWKTEAVLVYSLSAELRAAESPTVTVNGFWKLQ
jgi:TonB family protein